MTRDLIHGVTQCEWELLDAVKPARMLSPEELRAAMGFHFGPVEIRFDSPPCAHYAIASSGKTGGRS